MEFPVSIRWYVHNNIAVSKENYSISNTIALKIQQFTT